MQAPMRVPMQYDAGTETFAGTDAGTDAGTEAGTEVAQSVLDIATHPISCEGDYCPSARLSALSLPSDPAMATASGCDSQVQRMVLALEAYSASLVAMLTRTHLFSLADGEIELVLLNHLAGWASGASGNDAGSLTANFYRCTRRRWGLNRSSIA